MILETQSSKVYVSNDLNKDVRLMIEEVGGEKVFVLVDENTHYHCLPLLKEVLEKIIVHIIEIPSGESNKSITEVIKIWNYLNLHGASRNSLMINLGGGLLTDLGGFAASTFKRGMRFINIPTTLLGMVDAAVGGKTGINFNECKNEIGIIHHAEAVFVYSPFLFTIDKDNFLSGFAEMIKHALISSKEDWEQVLNYGLNEPPESKKLNELIAKSIAIKDAFVTRDPYEKNIRKSLNFGHTIAHALESKAMRDNQKLYHGHAVAYGMIVELYLSYSKCNFDWKQLKEISAFIHRNYGSFYITCDDYERLFESMTHDKKNEEGRINFTLLSKIGGIEINQDCGKETIFEALDFYRDAVGF